MFKSLRWRLQVWHAVVLLVVLTSFGAIVYRLHWQTRLQQVDAELDRTARIVMSQLRKLLPRPPRRQGHPDSSRPEGDSTVSSSPDQTIASKPLPSHEEKRTEHSNGSINSLRPQRERFPRDPGPLPAEFEQMFQGDEDSRFYFVIWGGNGEVLEKSGSAPEINYPGLKLDPDGLPKRIARERRGDGISREVIHTGMFNLNLLVGKSLEKDLTAHHQFGLLLAITGLIILSAGVLGGGWLTSRAIRPIDAMTTAAESISARNLSERINVGETDGELGKLAVVLNRTFDRLQAAIERQRQFTADASHELRTPLSVILAHTELALSRPRSSEDYRAAIETCRRASHRMKSLIDALMLLARFDSDNPSLKQERLDLEPLVQDCVELVQPLALDRGIHLECQTASCEVVGDWDRLSQVITNLLINSIRYNVDGGFVRATTRIEDHCAIISVADSGIGIAEDQLPLIFDRFYQVDQARSRAEGSCGLGLSICKTIVEAHGGTITATSQLNVGTTIEVRLPLAEKPVSPEHEALRDGVLISS